MALNDRPTSMVDEKLAAAMHDSDDEGVGEEDVPHDTEGIGKQGLGEVGGEKDKKGKPMWLCLVAGTLFWYKSQSLSSLKGDVNLKGATIEPATKPTPHSLKVVQGSKTLLVVSFNDAHALGEWMSALKAATALEAGHPPKVHRTKGLSMTGRMNKAVAGKMAVSGAGKSLAKATINEEAKLLISAVKNLITTTYDSKTANTVENNIIKLFVKYHYLMEEGQLEEDSWTTMDKGLREAFKWGVKITDNNQSGRVIPPSTLNEWTEHIQKALREVERKLFKLLEPHVQAKTLSRIGVCFNIFAAEEFLKAVFSPAGDDKVEKADAEALTYAMERYLQFSW